MSGSVTEKVIHLAECPVLAIRTPRRKEQRTEPASSNGRVGKDIHELHEFDGLAELN